MKNELKMKIKSIPLLSVVAKAINRSVLRPARQLISLPVLRENNKRLLDTIASANTGAAHKIWYFGVPTHSNLGDQAQKFVILSWLRRYYPDFDIIKIPSASFIGGVRRTLSAICEVISPDDLIVMQSGHTMDGLHPDEVAHRVISESFPLNRIVFFPTSIEFASRHGMRKDVESINKHARTLFLARDAVSADKARTLYPCIDVRLYPDVVTSLIGHYHFEAPRSGILLCTRNDGEKLYSYDEIDRLADQLSKLDTLDRTDTTVDWQGIDLDSDDAWKRIEGVVASYAKYRVIVTDRYHGTIFARIAGTPAIVLRTTDHKVTSGADWFTNAGDKAIVVAREPEEVPMLAGELIGRYPEGFAAPAFAASYYAGLKQIIESM